MKLVLVGMLTIVAGSGLVLGDQSGEKKPAQPQVNVELTHVHMCCDGCAKEVGDILTKVTGIKDVTVDQKANTARFIAPDVSGAQKALDALAADGFHGNSGTKDYAFKDDSGVKSGKAKTLVLIGFHNTCGGCVTSFREAIKNVPGVTGDNLKAKVTTCEIRGDFDAAALVDALNKGGFHVKVKN